MSHFYLDTSAVVKRYVPETGTNWIMNLLAPSANHTIFLAEITLAETAAAIAAKHRVPGGLTLQERDAAVDLFLCHCHNQYQLIPVMRAMLDRSIWLTQSYNLRGYDAVQLAIALSTRDILAGNGRTGMVFVTADHDLVQAAQNEGMIVDNPNKHA